MAYINGKSVLFAPGGTKVTVDGITQAEWDADTKADKDSVNSLSMCPSTSKIEIAITSGTAKSYTATANGYICFGVVSTGAERNYIYDGGDFMTSAYSSTSGQYIYLYLPATKGKVYEIMAQGTIRGCFLIQSKEI